jgi:hypothetical protein
VRRPVSVPVPRPEAGTQVVETTCWNDMMSAFADRGVRVALRTSHFAPRTCRRASDRDPKGGDPQAVSRGSVRAAAVVSPLRE